MESPVAGGNSSQVQSRRHAQLSSVFQPSAQVRSSTGELSSGPASVQFRQKRKKKSGSWKGYSTNLFERKPNEKEEIAVCTECKKEYLVAKGYAAAIKHIEIHHPDKASLVSTKKQKQGSLKDHITSTPRPSVKGGHQQKCVRLLAEYMIQCNTPLAQCDSKAFQDYINQATSGAHYVPNSKTVAKTVCTIDSPMHVTELSMQMDEMYDEQWALLKPELK
jgi:hypothetical protein